MQLDFHYYATYCAAVIAGYSHEESLKICYSDQFVDMCTVTLLAKIGGPRAAATTQLALELLNAPVDLLGIQDITRIWSSFHFLPFDLYADVKKGSKRYKNKYRLICNTNGDLLLDTVELAKGGTLQAIGIAMHVLADTWAHKYFAGTPSLVINNTDYHFYELIPSENGFTEKLLKFKHSPSKGDDLDEELYMSSLRRSTENSIMNLGHGRAGHLPDYSFMRYKYLPAWAGYEEILKDNPSDYYFAFCQMIEALKYLRGEIPEFKKNSYATKAAEGYEERIRSILETRQLDSSADWKTFGEELSGREIEEFDFEKYQPEYISSPESGKDDTFLGKFFLAALEQKSMITNKIFKSGNMLAGFSVDYTEKGFKGIRDYRRLLRKKRKEA